MCEPSAVVMTIGSSAPWADQKSKTCARSSSWTRSGERSGRSDIRSDIWSDILREPQLETALGTVGRVDPAGRHHLAARVEVHALGAVRVGVSEERPLPPAE